MIFFSNWIFFLSQTPLDHFHPLHRLLDINQAIAGDSKNFGKTLRFFFKLKSNLKKETHLSKMTILFQMIKKVAGTFTNSLVML